MKRAFSFLLLVLPLYVLSQKDSTQKTQQPKRTHNSIGIGIKAGLNFSNVTNASSIGNSSETGFQAGLFLDPETHSILGSRTELVYSRQGYDWSTGHTTGTVMLDYLTLAQLMAINITHFVQIQIGAQFSYLLSAKADSSTQSTTGNATADQILGYYNRFDYGFGGGIEVRPILGLVVGARYNISLNSLYKQNLNFNGATPPSFVPSSNDINFKNNLVQIYVGWRF
jgi:outer membrane protein with beta-barrel domain